MIKKVILATFPKQTRRGRIVKKAAVRFGLAKPFVYDPHYQLWMENAEAALFVQPLKDPVSKNPLFSVVVPAYNTQDKYLQPLIYSIINQSFQNWELVLADGSDVAERRDAIEQSAKLDGRIKYHLLAKNEGISGNTNQGVKQAKGDYIVFCDHDDVLSPHALNELAAALEDEPRAEVIYSDEDKITDDGLWRHWPHFKPNWSPHQFLTCNYTSHISAVKKTLVDQTGGLRTECNGAQDYDLLLRVHALPGKRIVKHIPKVLYHWRTADGSTAGEFSVKDYALKAGETALTQYLESQGVKAEVKCLEGRPGFYDPNIQPKSGRKVLVIIGEKDSQRMSGTIKNKYASLTRTDKFGRVEFITRHAYEKNKETYIGNLKDDDIVVSVKDNVVPKSPDWLQRLAGALELEDIHAVAPRVVAYDGRIWDMGIVEDSYGEPVPLFRGLLANDDTIYGHTEWIRDVDQLTGRFFAVRKKDWGDSDTSIQAKEGKYCTVWSVVEVVFYSSLSGKTKQYNENIEMGYHGHPTVLWQKK